MTQPTYDADHFAFYLDGTESASTIIGTMDNGQTLDVDTTYQIRYQLVNTNDKSGVETIAWEYNRNGTGWTAVDDTTPAVIQSYDSTNTTHGDDCTQRLASEANFVTDNNSVCEDDTGTGYTHTNSYYSECLFVFRIISGDVDHNDTIQIRPYETGGDTITYNLTATITVNEAGPPVTIDANTSNLTITGQQADIDAPITINANYGDLTVSGQQAKVNAQVRIDANVGSLTASGQHAFVLTGLIAQIFGTENANLLAYWPLNETPESQIYVTFNGSSTNIALTNPSELVDLHDDAFTVEAYVYLSSLSGTQVIVMKGDAGTGWVLKWDDTNGFGIMINCVSADLGQVFTGTSGIVVDTWYHVAATWDDATMNTPRIWLDGVEKTVAQYARTNAIASDSSDNAELGSNHAAGQFLYGRLGWVHISDNLRYTTNFTKPSRTTIPDVDGNTIGLWPLNEGYGSIAGDLSTYDNDGTIANGDWGSYPPAYNYQGVIARDGAFTGMTLGQQITPFICPLVDGVNDFVDVYSTSLSGVFDGATGTVIIFAKVSGSGVWTDGLGRLFFGLQASNTNRVRVVKDTASNSLVYKYEANDIEELVTKSSISETDWFMVAITWDYSGTGNMIAYYNGYQEGSPQAIGGIWSGSLADGNTNIGAYSITPVQSVFDGYLAHAAVWSTPLTAQQILDIFNASNIPITINASIGSLTITEQQAIITSPPPSVTINANVGSLTITEQQARIDTSEIINANYDSLTVTGQQARIDTSETINANYDSLTVTGQQAQVSLGGAPVTINANIGSLTLTDQQARIDTSETIDANYASITATGQQATIQAHIRIDANLGTLTITEQQARIDTSEQIDANYASLTITELQAQIVLGGAPITINANIGSLTLTDQQARIDTSEQIDANYASLTITELQAQVIIGGAPITINANVGSLTITELQANVIIPLTINANTGNLNVTGQQATIQAHIKIDANYADLTITTQQAQISTGAAPVTIDANTEILTLTGQQAQIVAQVIINANTGQLTATGQQANVNAPVTINANYGSLLVTGQQASLTASIVINANVGSLTITEQQAIVVAPITIHANYASLTASGQQARIVRQVFILAGVGILTITGMAGSVGSISGVINLTMIERDFDLTMTERSFTFRMEERQ